MKRTIALMLALLMLTGVLAACGKGNDEVLTTDGATDLAELTTQTDVVTEPDVPEDGFVKDNLPESLNFGQKEVTSLVWSDVENKEFEATEVTGDLINDAIYLRNRTVEERLGVQLKFVETAGNYSNLNNFVSTAQNMIMSGSDLDLMAAYSLTATSLVSKNLTYKLNEVDYLDLSMPWWPERLVEESVIKDNIYFCAGDLSTNMLHKMHAVFFDKEMTENHGISSDDLYAMALDGTWCIDKLFELTADVYDDVNNNGQKDNQDIFGLYLCDNYFDVFFYSSNLRTIERDESGTLVLSPSFGSEKTVNLAEKVGSFFADSLGAFYITDFSESSKMAKREAMMIISRCDVAYKKLRLTDGLEYGVLPVPKHDAEQETYVSCLAFPCTLYTMANCVKDPDMAGAVLEAMGSEGYRVITPALFETTMKLKYASDDVTAQTYDIIRTSVSFDLGRMCAANMNNLTYDLFRKACSGNTHSFATTYRANQNIMKKLLDNLVNGIE